MKINLSFLALVFLFTAKANADDPSVLNGLPTTDQVLNTIKGRNLKETYQKQVGALKILFQMVSYNELINPYTQANNSKLKPYKDRYNYALGDVYKLYSENVASLDIASEKRDLFNVSESYLNNEKFRQEVISKLLKPKTQKAYYDKLFEEKQKKITQANAQQKLEKRQQKEKNYRYNYKFIDKGLKPTIGGLIIIFIGILIWRPANRTIHKNNKAIFEGTAKNLSYEEALKFDRRQKWALLRARLSFLIWIIGACVLIMGLSNIFDYFE